MSRPEIDSGILKTRYERELLLCQKAGGDVEKYRRLSFHVLQLEQIRKGLESGLDVSRYADVKYTAPQMRVIRKGLREGIDLLPYADQGYPSRMLKEICRSLRMNYNIREYLDEGYDAEQLKHINNARELGVNLLPYLRKELHGVQLQEIVLGLKQKLDVSKYADPQYNWFQMREIRKGLEDRLDVALYANPDFSVRQMEAIREGLAHKVDVSVYARLCYEPEWMEEIRKKLEQTGSELDEEMDELLRGAMPADAVPEKKEEEEEATEDLVLASCITVSEDRMTAVINFTMAKDMKAEQLKEMVPQDVIRLLRHSDVKQGIYKERIKEMLEHKRFDVDVVVAEGKVATDGNDGKYKFYFRKDLDRRPRVLEDGSVDYKNMELFEAVQRDMLIAEYQPATMGVFGYDVTGQILQPKRGKELPQLRGTGFMMTEDKKQYYSLMDGIIELDEESNKLDIRNLYTVAGDVDASVGNIDFDGDVNIMGNVQSGFSVTATGSVAIDGHCEGCKIKAGKDVIIRKGCQGQGMGEIVAGGEITGKFFESATLTAKGNIEASYLLNCELHTDQKLSVEGRRGVIIGGYVRAKHGVTCSGLGNIAEIKTTVEVGVDKEDMAAYQELHRSIEKVDAELDTCKAALKRFQDLPTQDDKTTNLILRLNKAINAQKTQKEELMQEREKQKENMKKQKGARIQVNGRVYPGTLLYLNADPFVVKETYVNVDFVKHDNKIDTVNR